MPLRGRALILAFLLLCLAIPLNAATLSAGQENEASLACVLPTAYSEFWLRPSWWDNNPNVIHTDKFDIYSGQLQFTQSSLGAGSWSPAEDDDQIFKLPEADKYGGFSGAVSEANSAAKKMRKAKLSYETQKYRFSMVSADVQSMPIFMPLRTFMDYTITRSGGAAVQNFVFLRIEDIRAIIGYPKFSDYSNSWQASVSDQLDTLSSSSSAINSAFSAAQNEAESLRQKGAGNANYSGGAKGAYFAWVNFARDASVQCASLNGSGGASDAPTNSTPSGRYGIALHAASARQDVSANPPSVPDFSSDAAQQTSFASLSFGKGDARLWLDAKGHFIALADASEAMDEEYGNASSESENFTITLAAAVLALNKSSPELFTNYTPLVLPSSNVSSSPISGTPLERHNKILASLSSAQASRTAAITSKKSVSRQGYLSDAIILHRSSVVSSAIGISEAGELSSTMEWLASLAQNDADAAMAELEGEISSEQLTQNSAMPSALSSLEAARTIYNSAQLKSSLGQKYSLFRNASYIARAGTHSLMHPSSTESITELNSTLNRAASLAKSISLSCPAEESADIIDGVSQLRRQSSIMPYSPAFIELAQGYVSSALSRLERCFAPLTERYDSLSAQVEASSSSMPALKGDFDYDFAQYRKNGVWSDSAYSSSSKVNSLLIKWEDELLSTSSSSAQSSICQSLTFTQNDAALLPQTSVPIDMGGTLNAKSSFPSDIYAQFEITCALPKSLPALSEISSKPPFIASASISGKSARISFSSLPSKSDISITFASISTPFEARTSSSHASAQPNGISNWHADGTLYAEQDADALEIVLPVPRGVSMPILTFKNTRTTKSFNGRITQNSSGSFALFGVSGIDSGSSQFSISSDVIPPAVFSTSGVYAENGSYGGMLSISGIPPADYFEANVSEPACADATSVFVSGNGQLMATAYPKQLGSSYYSFRASPISESGEISVSARCSPGDAARVAREKLAALLAASNGKQSVLPILASANNSINSGKYSEALSALAKAESELSSIAADESASVQYSIERKSAESALAALKSAAKSAPDTSTFAKKMLSAANSLSSALSDADDYILQHQPTKALSRLRSANGDADVAIFLAAQDEYTRLKARLSSAKESSSSLSQNESLSSLLEAASSSLSFARSAMLEGNASALLASTTSADSSLSSAELLISSLSSSEMSSLSSRLALLATSQKSLEERAANYTSSLSRIVSGKGNYAPLLDSKTTNSLVSSSSKALLDAQGAIGKKGAAISEVRAKASLSEQSLSLASTRLAEGESNLASQAKAKARLAEAALSALPSDNAAYAQVSSDVSALAQLIDDGNYAEAILRADAAVSRSTKAIQSGTGGSLPLPLIFITLLLAAGLGYLFFARKKLHGAKEGESKDGKKKEKKKIGKA